MNLKPTILNAAVAVVTTGIFLTLSAAPVTTEKFHQRDKKQAVLLAPGVVMTSRAPVIQLSTEITAAGDLGFERSATNRAASAYASFRDAWFNDPSLLISSFSDDFTRSDDFRRLVQLGEAIYPYILADLSPETAIRWELVLTEIHGESVVPEREWGKPDKIASRWIKFLRLSI